MLNTYFKSLLVPSIHYGTNPYKKISKLYTTTHPQFLNVDFPAVSFSIMLVDGGFFWLICQCLFLNAPTMYYYHVGGNNITNLSLSTLGFLLWGTRGARVRRMGKGQQSAQLCRSLWSGWMPSAADDYDPRQTGSSIDRRRVGIAGQLSSLTQLSPLQKWSGLYYDLDLFF